MRRQDDRRRYFKRWALISSLLLANMALLFSLAYQSGVIYSVLKALVIFTVMYYVCRSVIFFWEKASASAASVVGGGGIKTTMDVLDDLDEQGIKVTYNPLQEQVGGDRTDGANEPETIPGQINVDAMLQRERE